MSPKMHAWNITKAHGLEYPPKCTLGISPKRGDWNVTQNARLEYHQSAWIGMSPKMHAWNITKARGLECHPKCTLGISPKRMDWNIPKRNLEEVESPSPGLPYSATLGWRRQRSLNPERVADCESSADKAAF